MLDFTEKLEEFLGNNRRPWDGKLHYSSAMADNLRHMQLEFAGVPKKDEDFMSLLRMNTGTLWHGWLDEQFNDRYEDVMTEVCIDQWAPEHWSGTLDMLLKENGVWYLYDYKVVNPISLPYVAKAGGKSDHKWQTSGYWYAAKEMLSDMGAEADTLSPYIQVCYIPAFTGGQGGSQSPFIATFEPIEEGKYFKEMSVRTTLALAYRADYEKDGHIIQDSLADPDLFEYKERKGKVIRVPHWRSKFCPYEGHTTDNNYPVCGCAKLSQKTLGPTTSWGHLLEEAVI